MIRSNFFGIERCELPVRVLEMGGPGAARFELGNSDEWAGVDHALPGVASMRRLVAVKGQTVGKALAGPPDRFLSAPVAVGSDRASIRTFRCVPSLNAVLVGVRS